MGTFFAIAVAISSVATEKPNYATELCFTLSDLPTELQATYPDLVRRIYLETWLPKYSFEAGDTIDSIAAKINKVSDRAISFSKCSQPESKMVLRINALCAWIRSNVEFFGGWDKLPGAERVRLNAPESVLSQRPLPKGNCDGHARLTGVLAEKIGLTTVGTGGALRHVEGDIPGTTSDGETIGGIPWNHGWTTFRIGKKWWPADLGSAWKTIAKEFREGWRGNVHQNMCLPLSREEWDLFLGTHFILIAEGKRGERDPLQNRSIQEWRSLDTSKFVQRESELRVRSQEWNRSQSRG
jgi:hypothetical protein